MMRIDLRTSRRRRSLPSRPTHAPPATIGSAPVAQRSCGRPCAIVPTATNLLLDPRHPRRRRGAGVPDMAVRVRRRLWRRASRPGHAQRRADTAAQPLVRFGVVGHGEIEAEQGEADPSVRRGARRNTGPRGRRRGDRQGRAAGSTTAPGAGRGHPARDRLFGGSPARLPGLPRARSAASQADRFVARCRRWRGMRCRRCWFALNGEGGRPWVLVGQHPGPAAPQHRCPQPLGCGGGVGWGVGTKRLGRQQVPSALAPTERLSINRGRHKPTARYWGQAPSTTVALTPQVDVCRHFYTQSETELARVNVRGRN